MGAFYSFIIFFPSLHFLLSFSMKLVISMLIIIISFTPDKFKDFFKYLSIFYLVSFVFGGTAFALFYFTNFNSILSNGIFYTNNFSFKVLFYSVALAYVLIVLSISYVKNKINKENLYKVIIIEFDKREKEINALIDTGNSLSDPISQFPVIVVEYNAIEALLPEGVKEIFKNDNFNKLEKITAILQRSDWMNRFRIIPFTSIGMENGILIGFKPDNVKMKNNGEIVNLNKIIVAISTNTLSPNGDYKALLNPDILV
ncbi:stage II sporulation protein GA (sporulation sigma-E factor processing peptidase) [Paramaledivibacter caminithermalis DSM 15212]|uniref:Stage II sporulation protein GA (Sporulation sigma-E factor processing peptidase) n=1 Tax=Paramaledivibacter caminithermalis (strain DSM 15212 / CIP 107654 / DViRD3) TaxID=1121301 RepID=A0A1M6S4G4_PARC5|nr:stage II sporulation protein GA (sporulation sigma-E factor processing peptidase) [Paramaledivibacter caminithermalis DSM 15212]